MSSAIDIAAWRSAVCEASHLPAGSRKRPRSVLADMDANEQRALHTPRKAKKRARQSDAIYEDVDDTPKPAGGSLVLTNPPVFPTPDRASCSSHASSDATGSSRTSNKRSSLRSPQREMAYRQLARFSMRLKSLHSLSLDASVGDVCTAAYAMQRAAFSQHILSPADDTAPMRQALGIDTKLGRTMFDSVFHHNRQSIGAAPALEAVEKIVEESNHHRKNAASEAAWNSAVHAPLLALARDHSKWRRSWRWDNMTTAAISPPTLLRALAPARSEGSSGKKVDFCLDCPLDDNITRALQDAEIELNQTDYFPVIRNLIAVSVETKTADHRDDEAKVQLSTWVTAQIVRLHHLLREAGSPSTAIPMLPLLLVRGHEWKFCCIKPLSENAADFYDDGIAIGSTAGVRGSYGIVCALQWLMDWAETVYRPWFQEHVLQPLLETIHYRSEQDPG